MWFTPRTLQSAPTSVLRLISRISRSAGLVVRSGEGFAYRIRSSESRSIACVRGLCAKAVFTNRSYRSRFSPRGPQRIPSGRAVRHDHLGRDPGGQRLGPAHRADRPPRDAFVHDAAAVLHATAQDLERDPHVCAIAAPPRRHLRPVRHRHLARWRRGEDQLAASCLHTCVQRPRRDAAAHPRVRELTDLRVRLIRDCLDQLALELLGEALSRLQPQQRNARAPRLLALAAGDLAQRKTEHAAADPQLALPAAAPHQPGFCPAVHYAAPAADHLRVTAKDLLQEFVLHLRQHLDTHFQRQLTTQPGQPRREVVDSSGRDVYVPGQLDTCFQREHEASPFLGDGVGCLMLFLFSSMSTKRYAINSFAPSTRGASRTGPEHHAGLSGRDERRAMSAAATKAEAERRARTIVDRWAKTAL